MEFKYLRLIKTIVEQGNLANSSDKLFLTQSALSHQLKELEKNLGFKIFLRSRNNWELTTEGKEFYKMACEVLSSIDEGLKDLKKLQKGTSGTIKISTECYSFYHNLPAFIQKIGILYPQINVDLILEATHHPIPKLISKEIDIAIVSSKPNNSELLSHEIFDDEIFAIMHKENKLSKNKYLDENHFTEINLIIHSYPLETVFVYENFCKPNLIVPNKITAIPLTEIALEMVLANMGVLCLPKWAVKHFTISDEIIFKKIGKNGLTRKHYLVTRKTDENKKYINDFILNFKDSFNYSSVNNF